MKIFIHYIEDETDMTVSALSFDRAEEELARLRRFIEEQKPKPDLTF